MSTPRRGFAGLIAGVALATLVAQFIVSRQLLGDPGLLSVLWRMAGYFTVLTNLLVLLTFAAIAMGAMPVPRWQAALTLWIGTVGALYHLVLAGIWQPVGLGWWADQGLHSTVPLMVLAYWLTTAPKVPLGWRDLPFFVIWPLAYVIYAMGRGALSGFYAYPFIDLPQIGAIALAINTATMLAGFVGAGALLIWLAQRRG